MQNYGPKSRDKKVILGKYNRTTNQLTDTDREVSLPILKVKILDLEETHKNNLNLNFQIIYLIEHVH